MIRNLQESYSTLYKFLFIQGVQITTMRTESLFQGQESHYTWGAGVQEGWDSILQMTVQNGNISFENFCHPQHLRAIYVTIFAVQYWCWNWIIRQWIWGAFGSVMEWHRDLLIWHIVWKPEQNHAGMGIHIPMCIWTIASLQLLIP